MAQDPKQLYSFLKANNLTQKSEVDFINEYSSDTAKQSQLYNFFRENNLTQKDEASFLGEYFPNADGVSPQGSGNISEPYVDPTTIGQPSTLGQQEPNALSLGQYSPENIAPQIAQANQIASEYGLEGESFEVHLQSGEELVSGAVDASGRLVNPVIINRETGAVSNPIQEVIVSGTREELMAQNARIAEEERLQDKGFWSDTYNSLQTGLTDLNASLSSIPEYLYRIAALPQNLLADAIENNAGEGSADWLRARYENVENGVYNPLRILSDYSKGQSELSESYSQQITQFDNDIAGSIGDGNFVDAGRQILNSIVQSAPAIVGMVATSGAGGAAGLGSAGRTALTALPFAAGSYQDIEDNPNMNENMKLVASAMKGLSEVVFEESFGTLPLVRSLIDKSIGREAAKEVVEGYMAKLLNSNGIPASAFKGAISEGATTLSQNMVEKYSGENPDKDLWEGVADAMIVGSVMDAGVSGLNSIADRIKSPEIREEVSQLEQQITSMRQDLQNLSAPQAEVLQRAIEVKAQQINSAISRDEAASPVLTQGQQAQMDTISKRAEELQAVIESENISEETATAIQSEIDTLNQEREMIVDNAFSQGEVDQFVQTFQENNPNTTVDVFEDLPDSIVRTFNRVESNIPTDITLINEASDWMYGKYRELTDMKQNPDRLLTISQIEGIQDQLAQDIELLENYRYEQTGERSENTLESETATDTVAGQESEAQLQGGEVGSEAAAQDITVDQEQINQTDETQQPSVESTEIPMEGSQVAPLGETGTATQELVTRNLITNLDEVIRDGSGRLNIQENGKEVPFDLFDIVIDPETNTAEVAQIKKSVKSDSNRGIGRRAYIELGNRLAERGIILKSAQGNKLTDGLNLWNRLVKDGYAVKDGKEFRFTQKNETNTETETALPEAGPQNQDVDVTAEQVADIERRRQEELNKIIQPIPIEVRDDKGNLISTTDKTVEINAKYDAEIAALNESAQKPRSTTTETQTQTNDAQSQETIQENEQAPVRAEEVQESPTGAEPVTERGRATKGMLEGISRRLSRSGLANNVRLATNEEVSADLSSRGISVGAENVNGYLDSEGNIVINQDRASIDSPIHEFSHAWEQAVARDNPQLHSRGIELIQTPEGNPYVDHVRRTQPGLKGAELYKEALAQAIGDRGARLIESRQQPRLREWLKQAWEYIGSLVGISDLTAEQIANMTLNEYADAVAVDLLSGKPYNTTANGDIVMETSATSESGMSDSEKKIAAFMEKMRNKNNIQYQGNIDNNRLSPEDLVEFMDVAEEMAKIGQISTLKDLQDIARSIGIRSDRDVRTAWAIAKEHITGTPETTAFKKSQITEAIGQRSDGLSIEEKREIGKRIVDEGILNPDQFVADIIENPIALQTHEVFALAYGYSNLQNRIDDVSRDLRNNPMDSDLLIQQDALLSLQTDYQNAIALTATEQGQALAVRDIESDADFNAVSALREMKKVGEVDAETAARVDELGKELNAVKSELRQRVRELDNLRSEQDASGINSESQAVKPRRTGGSVRARRDAVEVLDSLDLSSFGMAGLNFQANDVLRFSIAPNTQLSQSLSDAVSVMKNDINGGMSIADALEKAVDTVNASVGKGNWNELAFRSKFVNAYTDKGHVAPVRKPYIGTDGKPVVPGTYLSDIVAKYRSDNGQDMTIDQMVEAAKSELGTSFSDRDVRDAISGYGRATNKSRTDDQKNVSTARTIARLQSRLEDLQNLGYSPTSKQGRARNVNEEINDLRLRINELIDSLVDSPEYKAQMKQALDQKKRYIENYIKEVEARTKFYREANRRGERVPDGYFTKQPKYDFTSDPDVIALEKRREETKNKLKEEVYKHALKNRTMPERAFDFVNDVIFNTTRMLSAGADLSSYLVQGGFVTMSNPVLATRSLIESVGKAGSTEQYNEYFNNLQRQPLYEYARSAKLNMQLPSFYQAIQEEQLGTSNPITKAYEMLIDKAFGRNAEQAQKWKDRFPFTAAERQYSIFLSDIRFKLFEQAVNDAQNHFGLDVKSANGREKMKDIATAINDITMASNIRSLQGSTRLQKLGNMVFFSLRKLAAGWKLMTKLPYYGGAYVLNKGAALGGSMGITNAANIKNATDWQSFMFQKLYGRYAGASLGVGAMITIIPSLIANALYDPEEDDEPLPFYNPNVLNGTSSDFMKLRFGNTRMDFTLGIAGNTVLLSRIAAGGYMTSSDPVFREFNERTAGMANKSEKDIIIDYMSNKLAPTPSLAYNYFLGGQYGKAEATDRLAESFYPMWISGITEQYEATNSIANAAAFGALGIMGISANTYGGVEFADHRGTDNAEARRVFEKLLISDTSPTRKNKKMYSESGVTQLQSSDFKEQYKKDYDEYMTQATLSNKDIISNAKLSPEKVESLVNNMKARANKYAEIKSTGIYLDETFRKVRNSRGEVFKLKNDQLAEKAKIIKQYMSGRGRGSLSTLRRDAREKLREEKKKVSPEILEMEAYLNLYTEANREASERMTRLIDGGRIVPIPEFEYDPKIDDLGEYDEMD